jgi:hypothetical protein
MKNTFPAFLLLLLINSVSSAKCIISPENIEKVAANVKWQNENGTEENTAVIRADVNASMARGKNVTVSDYEAFLRPDRDEAFQPLPIPLFMVQMDKKVDSIYICAHLDSGAPAKNLTVVYFLRQNRISPITPMPLPFRQLGKLIWGPLENTPFIVTKIPLTVLGRIQAIFVHAFSDLTRFGIDRVRITSTKIELLSGGNPTQFDRYALRKVIPIKE